MVASQFSVGDAKTLRDFDAKIGSRRRLPVAVHPAVAGRAWETLLHGRKGCCRWTAGSQQASPAGRAVAARPGEVSAIAAERWLLFLAGAWSGVDRQIVAGKIPRCVRRSTSSACPR